MGSVTSSLELLHLHSLVIVHEGGQARATFRALPCRYLFHSYVRVLPWPHQTLRPLYAPCSESHDVVFNIILTITDGLGWPRETQQGGVGDAALEEHLI